MKKMHIVFLGGLLGVLFLGVGLAGAQGGIPSPGRDEKVEQEILYRLAAINPEAVPIFQQATADMDGGSLTAAKQEYEQVLQLAPSFPDALRRLSYVEIGLGLTEAALGHARDALAAKDSPFNHSALARALIATEDRSKFAEALSEARLAVQAVPDDPDVNLTLLFAGAANEDEAAIRQATQTLLRVAPDLAIGHYFAGLVAAADGQWEKAEQELLFSQKLGMPAEQVQQALDQGIASQARQQRLTRWSAYAVGGWLTGLAGLFVIGLSLSQLTLAAVRRPQPTAEFQVSGVERFIRTLYRGIIALTSIYFYISIPFVILAVLAGAAAVGYLFLIIGRIPVQLAVIVIAGTIYSLIAIIRGVFTRIQEGEPGHPLLRSEAPHLWLLAEAVARRVGTRPIDAIYITPAVEIAVSERGGLIQKLRGHGQRCLILGLGALPGMTQGQFQAIFAHEYGHFNNRDTAGGNLARQVSASLQHMAYRLAVTGQAQWYNPAWLFFNGFYRLFLRLTLGASRLQEILADRYAALAYGTRNFADGLTHIVRQSLYFDALVNKEVELALHINRPLSNLYTLPVSFVDPQRDQLEGRLQEIMERPTSPYDSHPAVKERVRLVQQLNVVQPTADNPDPAWNLLPNAEALQAEMTARVQTNVWNQAGRLPL